MEVDQDHGPSSQNGAAAKENKGNVPLEQPCSDPTATKELLVQCGNDIGFVEVAESDTLEDVRALILQDFDEDMLPDGAFYFSTRGIRISHSQEGRKKAWDLIHDAASKFHVGLHAKKKPREENNPSEEALGTNPPRQKKARLANGPGSVSFGSVTSTATTQTTPAAAAKNPPQSQVDALVAAASGPVDTPNVASSSHAQKDQNQQKEAPSSDDGFLSSWLPPPKTSFPLAQQLEKTSSSSFALGSIRVGSHGRRPATTRAAANRAAARPMKRTTTTTTDKETTSMEATKQQLLFSKSLQHTVPVTKPVAPEKPPVSPFALFVEQDWKENPERTHGLSLQEASRASSRAWENLSPMDRRPYQDRFDMARKQYALEKKQYLRDLRAYNLNCHNPYSSSNKSTGLDGSSSEPAATAAAGSVAVAAMDKETTAMETTTNQPKASAGTHTSDNKEAAMETTVEEEEDDNDRKPAAVAMYKTQQNRRKDGDVTVTKTLVSQHQHQSEEHKVQKEAREKSRSVLQQMETMLAEYPLFCSEQRRQELRTEIQDSLNKATLPETIVGVLGNTGVGKSSLLNALLDEAAVLPTSGSRGCTATVVELRVNTSLLQTPNNDANNNNTVPVYKGTIEFISLAEWQQELKHLVDECSTLDEKTIYARPPDDQRQPEAAAAWQKINQVYGFGKMEQYHCKGKEWVYQQLANDIRVKNLLTPDRGSQDTYKTIAVSQGSISLERAGDLLQPDVTSMNGRLRREKKKWAQSFRAKINDYVYRKGNGDQPQTWPLIRKVVLEGPWSVLSTGACLVDLPGIRDANAARAKVSENYLQNCSQIWVVAPIKRAVDDGTAKELLGEQFKRRLLMDGQYGNVSFICTQTDDCEATETMRDHQDVAKKKPGRWEKMTDLSDRLSVLEKQLNELRQQQEDLKADLEEAQEEHRARKEDYDEAKREAQDDEPIESADDELAEYLERLQQSKKTVRDANSKLDSWNDTNAEAMEELLRKSRGLQIRLKSICAQVRNEYSKACLQADFRAGLKELTRGNDDDDMMPDADVPKAAIPDDFALDVYCISANDYLKIQGIKPSTDGPPTCFSNAADTQIPVLRTFVHKTTASHCESATRSFCETTSDLLDRLKLVGSDAKGIPSGSKSRRCKAAFELEMQKLERKVSPLVNQFKDKVETKVRSVLQPALKTGAQKGNAAALSTVASWGSKSRRSRNERAPNRNGLYYSTYFATARRDGVYVSNSAGPIDMNQELCDPVEKEFSADWQRIMDSSIRVYLRECENKLLGTCASLDREVASAFVNNAGLSANQQFSSMVSAASRSCSTAVKSSFRAMNELATASQRDLNRSLLPAIQASMKKGYTDTISVAGGSGKFMRMKDAMSKHAQHAIESMFDDATKELLASVGELILKLSDMIQGMVQVISKALESVYSVMWEDRQSNSAAVLDPTQQEEVRKCRDKVLPLMNELTQVQSGVLQLLGITREDLELDVMAVVSLDQRWENKLKAAEEKGEVMDLCDSDDDGEYLPTSSAKAAAGSAGAAVVTTMKKIKPEPRRSDLPSNTNRLFGAARSSIGSESRRSSTSRRSSFHAVSERDRQKERARQGIRADLASCDKMKSRLVSFFGKHRPGKDRKVTIERLLTKYAGKTEDLNAYLEGKYGEGLQTDTEESADMN